MLSQGKEYRWKGTGGGGAGCRWGRDRRVVRKQTPPSPSSPLISGHQLDMHPFLPFSPPIPIFLRMTSHFSSILKMPLRIEVSK